MSPSHRMRIDELEGKVATLKKEIERLQALINETADATASNERQKAERMENVKRLLKSKGLMQEGEEELKELKGQIHDSQSGQIHVLREAYPGVCISIGLSRLMLSQSVSYATFREEGGTVQFTNCRFRRKPSRMRKRR